MPGAVRLPRSPTMLEAGCRDERLRSRPAATSRADLQLPCCCACENRESCEQSPASAASSPAGPAAPPRRAEGVPATEANRLLYVRAGSDTALRIPASREESIVQNEGRFVFP